MLSAAEFTDDITALKAMLIAAALRDQRKDERIAHLKKLVTAFMQAAFGRRSEKTDPDQFELALEDLETAIAVVQAEERLRIVRQGDRPNRVAPIVARSPSTCRGSKRSSNPKAWSVAAALPGTALTRSSASDSTCSRPSSG